MDITCRRCGEPYDSTEFDGCATEKTRFLRGEGCPSCDWWDLTVEKQFAGATGEPGLLFRDIIPTGDSIDWRAVAESILEGAEE